VDTNKNEIRQVSQRALEVFEERDRAFRVLYDTVIELETHKNVSPYLILARNLKKICQSELVAIGCVQDVPSEVPLEAVVSELRGEEGRRSPAPLILTLPEPVLSLFRTSFLEDVVHPEEFLSPDFLKTVLDGRYAQEVLSFSCFSCKSHERLVAAGIIAVDKARNITPRDIIEIYLNFAGMVIERFQSIETIKDRERTLQLILDSIPTGIMMIDREKKCVINANTAARNLIGCQGRNLSGVSCQDLFCLSPGTGCPITDEDGNIKIDFLEKQLRKDNGEILPILKSVVPLHLNGRDVFIESFIDISERKRQEAMIAEEKERLAVMLRSIGEGVVAVNRDKEILFMNKVAERLLGVRQVEVEGKSFDETVCILDPRTKDPIPGLLNRVVEKGDIVELHEDLLVSRDGIHRLISNSIAPIRNVDSEIIGAVLVLRDISEKRRMEEDIIKKQKLDSLGLLAGGIAHDFNNILAVIVTQVAVAKITGRLDASLQAILDDIEAEALRARTLTQQLMTFSKGGAPVKKLESLKEVIVESSRFVLHGSNVLCAFSIPDDLWAVEVDEGQINQVIQNMVLNAQQAMPQGGKVDITANNVFLKSPFQNLPAGAYVRLDIADSGEGIAPDIQDKIFDPYFTTKSKGNGLGLAIVFSVVKRHGGMVCVESSPGRGALFSVYLPACQDVVMSPAADQKDVLVPSGHKKILLMDDEDALRNSMASLLSNYGFDVHAVAHGEDAIQKFQKEKIARQPFDLVILDLTIKGGWGGKETVGKLRDISRDVKIIAASGYSQDPVLAHYREYGFDGIVVKPFTVAELMHAMSALS